MTLQQQKNKNDINSNQDEDDSYDSNHEKEDSTSSSNNNYNSTTTNTTTVDNNILNYKNISNNNLNTNTPIQTMKTKINKIKKYLYLPRRSLLILRGDARYLWSHGIAPRTTDKVNSKKDRKERLMTISLNYILFKYSHLLYISFQLFIY